MRDFVSERNLRKAFWIGSAVTLTAVPRMQLAGVNLGIYIPAGLLSMVAASGVATAWGRYGGLHGFVPHWRRAISGVTIAFGVAMLAWWPATRLDVALFELLHQAATPSWLTLRYPADPVAVMALLLWVAGFETVFFQAAVISYLARLTRDWRPALAGAVVLRGWIWHNQINGLLDGKIPPGWMVLAVMTDAAVAGGLYVKAGWPAAAAYAVTLNLRHFRYLS